MRKFQVGDRVVVINNNHPTQSGYVTRRGEVALVTDESEYEVTVLLDINGYINFDSSELEYEEVYEALSAIPGIESLSTDFNVETSGGTECPGEDVVNHPSHYTSHPSGIECIQVTEHMNFNLGNATKYIWRAGLKSGNPLEDLEKAAWYVNREIQRLGGTVADS